MPYASNDVHCRARSTVAISDTVAITMSILKEEGGPATSILVILIGAFRG